MCSGQEIGPLLLEVPLFNMNSDRSNLDDNSKNEDTDMGFEVSELAGWKGSFLLNEVTIYTNKLLPSALCMCNMKT